MDARAQLDEIARTGEHEEAGLRVVADQLILDGDSLGELLVVASQRLVLDTPELRRREEKLIAEHEARIEPRVGWGLGLRWRRGLVDAIDMLWARETHFTAIEELAEESAVRFVRRMVFTGRNDSGNLIPMFADLARLAVSFPRLVEVCVRTREAERFSIPDVPALLAACPRLEVLELDGYDVELPELAMPALRRLALPRLAPEDARRIVSARLPRLAELALGFWILPSQNLAATIGPLLHRDFGVSSLSLEMPDRDASRWLIAELPGKPITRTVKRLGFGRTRFDDEMLVDLIERAPSYQHLGLERLELRDHPDMTPWRIAELMRAYPKMVELVRLD